MENIINLLLVSMPFIVLFGLLLVLVKVVQLFKRVRVLENRVKELVRKEEK